MDLSREISAAVARFVARVAALAGDLAHAQLASALDGPLAGRGGGRHRAVRAAAPVARGRVPIGGRRTASELERLRQRLLAHITAHPGQRIEQIKVALGASTSELGVPVQKLLYADLIRSEGERRATRYFPPATEETEPPPRKARKAARGAKPARVARTRKAETAVEEPSSDAETAVTSEAAAIEEALVAEAAAGEAESAA